MAGQVSWLLELTINPGRGEDFKTLVQDMVGATLAAEPGTLAYEWSTSADGTVCHIYERYFDSAAVMVHLGAFGEDFAQRFLDILVPTRFVVYGTPSPEVKEALAAFGPVYMETAGGFSR